MSHLHHQFPVAAVSPAPVFPAPAPGLHEFFAEREADGASLSAFMVMLGAQEKSRTILWVQQELWASEIGWPHPPGLAELGLDPAKLLFVRVRDAVSALQAGLEGARHAGLATAIVAIRGVARSYDLTASRRLAMAARAAGGRVLLARMAASPTQSAAHTRWLVRAAPSHALAAKAPGHPAFHLTMLRARDGREGLQHHLEWNRDAQCFTDRLVAGEFEDGAGPSAGRIPPLPRAVVPLPLDRSGPCHEPPGEKRAG
jgi:protein ImuA